MGRKKSDRLLIANEVKMQCIDHDLMGELGTKVLFRMLDNYVDHGTTYINKELGILQLSQRPRKYVVKLYNDPSKVDTVVISVDERPNVLKPKKKEELPESSESSESEESSDSSESEDEEIPDLVE